MPSVPPDVRVCADPQDLSERAAAAAAELIIDAVRRRGACFLVLSGGRTPAGFYERLASTYRHQLPWPEIHVFWGDERYVDADASASNYRMAREALLDRVPLPPGNVHPMSTRASVPDAAAREYEATVRAATAGRTPAFDLVLLGLGEDGHTASLFPRSSALEDTGRWVVAVAAPGEPSTRLTMTFPALKATERIFVLASGPAKAPAVARVLNPATPVHDCPAAALRPIEGVTWWFDRAATKDSAAGDP